MSVIAFFLIVSSAVLHASWNLLAKKSVMSVSFYGAICFVASLIWCNVQFWTPVNVWSLPLMFWVFMLSSLVSDTVYCVGLVKAYRTMEMSIAYPMMRALPLLFTAGITSVIGIGNKLTPLSFFGMAIVFVGCLLMPLKDFKAFNWRYYFSSKMFFIILVACGTTGYTILDSQAQAVLRGAAEGVSKPIVSITYYSTRSLFLSLFMLVLIFTLPGEKNNFCGFFKERNFKPMFAGAIASMTYVTVLMAMNYVTNVSYVQVFRQLGLVFGLLGGIFILKEQCNLPKFIGVALIISGLVVTVL